MPLHGSYLQRDCYLFFNNLEKNLEFKYNKNDIIDIEKTKEKIEKNLSLIKEAYMEMTYEGEYSNYYDNFAKENKEEELLNKSKYVLFDLDEYAIKLSNGNYRYWIYENELEYVIDILIEKKKNIEKELNNINVNAGVALALLYTKL
jgi:hypothetical protein